MHAWGGSLLSTSFDEVKPPPIWFIEAGHERLDLKIKVFRYQDRTSPAPRRS